MQMELIIHPWDQAERLARAIIALSGAGLAIWALLRWPLAVLRKAALMSAVRATLKDEEARASMTRVLREQLLAGELARLGENTERLEELERERTRRRRGA
jgi:hypothetical protein